MYDLPLIKRNTLKTVPQFSRRGVHTGTENLISPSEIVENISQIYIHKCFMKNLNRALAYIKDSKDCFLKENLLSSCM